MSKNLNGKKPKAFAIFVWALIGGLIGWQANALVDEDPSLVLSGNAEEAEEATDLDLFWNVWALLETEYIEINEVQDQDRVYGAVKGMVESLDDPYTVFMDPEESEAFEQSLNSELEGIGAELTQREGRTVVVAPLKDSPAEAAGLLSGDFIYLVDGEPTSDKSLWDIIMEIRGEPGTEVVLTVVREGEEDTIDIAITRSKIQVPSIETEFIEQDGKTLAHVALYSFAGDSYLEFLDAIREAQLQGADGMVLDLRMNGGGFLDVSIEILGEFFEDEMKAVIVKNGDGTNEIIYTNGNGSIPDLPVVVLIDEGSASASEIVAGALQDHGRALIMGETSFGKGSVQELLQLIDGSSIRITIAKWFTPDDRTIYHEGIVPDIEIEMDPRTLEDEEDVQLDAAFNYLTDIE